ncbi:lactacin F inducer peptide precursor [Lactobacillus gasseri]|jgi:hypothetical protein|uniref:lactacin F inducer peptide precursor n=1 Tax=Lactobacillus gasseri TaxID=1596 RepID=UPI001F5775DA|nr:lactacin F inducer peptide precursor [Lactobacillus gasseri]UNL44537.1 lactacin F inducer peptide precursor [Lactobacillus gasseri]
MKDIRKENIVKATTLSKEEMIEVVGGKAVNGFVNGNFSSRISLFCTFTKNDSKINE